MPDISKQYDPAAHEKKIYEQWEKSGAFVADNQSAKEPFVISMPPPNATGELHVGHALFLTIQDILIRASRMQGYEALWLPGTDHAAIATENVVIRQLREQEGSVDPRQELGREELLKRIHEYVEKSRGTIRSQIRSIGASCDWSRERYTLDPALSRCVNEVFKKMYDNGLIYRGNRIVNWDPALKTTVSDDEIEWQEERTPLYTFQYGPFQISTARPETKFGDKYVVMHPDDARYKEYRHGQSFECEWITGKITATVIKDMAVDPGFGTGVMTITPWHDAVDFTIAERHHLDKIQIIDFDGRLLPVAGAFAGMSIAEARSKVVETLKQKGLLVRVDEKYSHNIATNSRGGGIIEPQIKLQWFITVEKPAVQWKGKTCSLKEVLHDVVEAGDIKILPEKFHKMYFSWINNLRDWCISRQIWWGHRIPVWYRGDEMFVGTVAPADSGWEQDPDTLDTWFSSGLWTWSTLVDPVLASDHSLSLHDLLSRSPDFKKFHPTTVLETGYDILFFWVARMMLLTTYAIGDIPFKEVYLHGLVVTRQGKKMSKSDPKTMIDPVAMIKRYGADATRFGLIYQLGYGNQTIRFDEQAVKAARNFANKIWNLARFIHSLSDREQTTVADEWMQRRLTNVTTEVTELIRKYKLGEAARLLHHLIWDDFADWYVEIIKTEGSTMVARDIFKHLVRLLHPFMPFITEVLWQQITPDKSLILSEWPSFAPLSGASAGAASQDAEKTMRRFQDIVTTTRSIRTLLGIKPGTTIDLYTPEKVSLSASLERLCHVRLVKSRAATMHDFPLISSQAISLGSAEITPDSLKRAQTKLESELTETKNSIASQTKTLEAMRGRASDEAVQEKETAISTAQAKQRELERTLEFLEK